MNRKIYISRESFLFRMFPSDLTRSLDDYSSKLNFCRFLL